MRKRGAQGDGGQGFALAVVVSAAAGQAAFDHIDHGD